MKIIILYWRCLILINVVSIHLKKKLGSEVEEFLTCVFLHYQRYDHDSMGSVKLCSTTRRKSKCPSSIKQGI